MKILWLTTRTTLEHARLLGLEGSMLFGWIDGLAAVLRGRPELTLAIASPAPVTELKTAEHDHIRFYAVPAAEPGAGLRRVLADFAPDAVHMHGTTPAFSPCCGSGGVPWIVSIEGIIGAISDWLNGNLYDSDLPFSPKNFLLRRTFKQQRRQWRLRAETERAAIAAATDLVGRTPLDRAYCRVWNPRARYHCVNEILRPEFYTRTAAWSFAGCTKHRIFIPSMAYPMKGAHVALQALALVKREYPDAALAVPGAAPRRRWPLNNPYQDYLLALARRPELAGSVEFLPALDAPGMIREMLASHVFAMTSFMENSPNALAEAQLLGVPHLAAAVGGTPAFVAPRFLVQCGDPTALAAGIMDIFSAGNAIEPETRAVAAAEARRHDPAANADAMLKIYQQVSQHGKN